MIDPSAYIAYLGGGIQTAEQVREATCIGDAVDQTKRDLGALPLGSVLRMADEDMMRRAIRNYIKLKREADAQHQEAV